jgi:hypothetical protein
MKFVLVNGRTPCTQSFCVMCDEPIGAGYLREIGTQLCYCDHDCYADPPRSRSNIAKLLDRVTALPSVPRAYEREGITDKIC